MEPLYSKEKVIENNIINKKKVLRNFSLMNKIELKQFKFIYNEIIKVNKRKNSFDFTQIKYNIKDLEEEPKIKRKYTLENYSSIKNFVPQLRPIESKISPSKLFLNGNKTNHFNQKINSNDNRNYTSCPNSEIEEVDSEYNSSQNMISFCPSKNNNNLNGNKFDYLRKPSIKDVRKKLNRTKNNKIQKSFSKDNSLIKEKFENKFNLDNLSGSDLDDEEFNNYLNLRKISNNKNYIFKDNSKNRTRINSCSILNILEKKFKSEE